jgi:hypothetical protein
MALEILIKYNNTLPRVPINQRMNTNLRTIASLLNWTEIKLIPGYDNFGNTVEVKGVELKEIFSSKFMRKTAASIDNHIGVSIKTSMKRTGHKTFSAYSRYVDVDKTSMIHASKLWDNLMEGNSQLSYATKDIVSMEEITH